jgi:hypothetical protein
MPVLFLYGEIDDSMPPFLGMTLLDWFMRSFIGLFLFLVPFITNGQKQAIYEINKLNGIWIAEKYYHSFEKTKSALKSEKAFPSNEPVGLRINSKEIKNGILNVAYALLHDHQIYQEVSKYTIIEGDTVQCQVCFDINIKKGDSLGYYRTTNISNGYFDHTAYFKWQIQPDTSIFLYYPKADYTIKYKRVKSSIDKDYPFPNPLYFYTRSRTLSGNYVLKDSADHVLAQNLIIKPDGKIFGYLPLENKTALFSTDIYCGIQLPEDLVEIYTWKGKQIEDYESYAYIRIDEQTIHLCRLGWAVDNNIEPDYRIVGNIVYQLIKK